MRRLAVRFVSALALLSAAATLIEFSAHINQLWIGIGIVGLTSAYAFAPAFWRRARQILRKLTGVDDVIETINRSRQVGVREGKRRTMGWVLCSTMKVAPVLHGRTWRDGKLVFIGKSGDQNLLLPGMWLVLHEVAGGAAVGLLRVAEPTGVEGQWFLVPVAHLDPRFWTALQADSALNRAAPEGLSLRPYSKADDERLDQDVALEVG